MDLVNFIGNCEITLYDNVITLVFLKRMMIYWHFTDYFKEAKFEYQTFKIVYLELNKSNDYYYIVQW